jgi:hypothetical protein
MKLSNRTVLTGLAVGALLGLGLSGVVEVRNAATVPALAVSGGCPRYVKEVGTFEPPQTIAVMRALKAQVPRVYANFTSMGQPAWPRFQIQALVHLNQLPLGGRSRPAVQGLDRYERIAVRACGRTAALASVVVFLQFPNCQLPCAFGWTYLTPYPSRLAPLDVQPRLVEPTEAATA